MAEKENKDYPATLTPRQWLELRRRLYPMFDKAVDERKLNLVDTEHNYNLRGLYARDVPGRTEDERMELIERLGRYRTPDGKWKTPPTVERDNIYILGRRQMHGPTLDHEYVHRAGEGEWRARVQPMWGADSQELFDRAIKAYQQEYDKTDKEVMETLEKEDAFATNLTPGGFHTNHLTEIVKRKDAYAKPGATFFQDLFSTERGREMETAREMMMKRIMLNRLLREAYLKRRAEEEKQRKEK